MNAKKAAIILPDGTENRITDGDSYVYKDAEATEPDAAVFSGNGSLAVVAN